MGLTIEIDVSGLTGLGERLKKRFINAQNTLTLECKKAADIFTPMEFGSLRNNIKYTLDDNGARNGWIHLEPYARRQWWGVRKDGSPFQYSFIANDKARQRWTEHAAENEKDRIIAGVKKILEGKV